MERGDSEVRGRPFRIETVRGEPYEVGERRLTPIARIVSFGKASGTIGAQRIGGWGGGFVRITPLAILEETGEGERRIPITDATAVALRGMFGAAVAAVLFFASLRWLARWWQRARARTRS